MESAFIVQRRSCLSISELQSKRGLKQKSQEPVSDVDAPPNRLDCIRQALQQEEKKLRQKDVNYKARKK